MNVVRGVVETLEVLVAYAAIRPAIDILLDRTSWWGTGRHISRPLRRRYGLETEGIRIFLALAAVVGFVAHLAGLEVPGRHEFAACFNVWLADDYWFGDRPRRRGKIRGWAKAKLRKAKPVMRRLAEQWKPAPSRWPVPA